MPISVGADRATGRSPGPICGQPQSEDVVDEELDAVELDVEELEAVEFDEDELDDSPPGLVLPDEDDSEADPRESVR